MIRKIALLSILIVFCLIHAASAKERLIEIKARRFAYTPNIVEVERGDTVTLRLISEDVHHGLYLDGYEVNTTAIPGQDGSITFVADKTGRFTFRCSMPCGTHHPYMVGYFKVTPNYLFNTGIALVVIIGLIALFLSMRAKRYTTDMSQEKLLGIIPLTWRFELTKYKPVRTLLKSRWVPLGALLMNLLVFMIILAAGITGGFGPGNYNFGIMIVWILWWVLLMFIMVPVVGRLWCMMCPFPIFGDWIQRGKLFSVGRQKSWGLNKLFPRKWRNLWLPVMGFGIVTWGSGFFTVKPIATFILLGSIIVLAIIISMIFGKRTFCLYVCPVSGFQGLYSNFSCCEVRSKDPEICKNHKQKTCVSGNENGYGCPWMELPFEMNRNTYCGLCFECFKTCPYDNMAFNLRPAGTDLLNPRRKTDDLYDRRSYDESFKALTMMGIFMSFFIVFQGPYAFLKDNSRAVTVTGYLSYITEAMLTDFLVIPFTYLCFAWLSKLSSGAKDVKLKNVFVNFSYTLVPFGLAAWAAFSVGIVLPNGSYVIHILSDPFAWGWNLFGTANFPWTPVFTRAVPYLQAIITFLGYIIAMDYGFKLAMRTYPTLEQVKRGWIPILVFLTLVAIGFLWLFLY